MKNIIKLFLLFSLISACDNKSCEDVLCGPNQTCNKGFCYCLDGYEGSDCQDLASAKYIGNYNVSQSCSQGNGGNYVTFGTIQADGSPRNELLFYNFLGLGQTAIAYIGTDGSGKANYIRFPNQNLGATTIVGEGYYQEYGSTGRINIDIQISSLGQLSVCNYVYY